MKKTIAIATAFILSGCSNVPDASDIRDQLEQGWAGCPGIKVVDVTKTNGIDHGGTYQMAVSWKFKALKDITMEKILGDQICSGPADSTNLMLVAMRDPNFAQTNGNVKKGDSIEISDTFTMVKSEKGWIVK